MTKKELLSKLKGIRIIYIVGICLLLIDLFRDMIYQDKSPFSDFTIGDGGAFALMMSLWFLMEVIYSICKHYVQRNMGECCGDGGCRCNKS